MTERSNHGDEWLTTNEVSKLIGIGPKTVVRMVERGELTGYRVASRWRFKRHDIEAYLEAHRYGPERPLGTRQEGKRNGDAQQEPGTTAKGTTEQSS
jgi:excisionase family DNA binding protein